MFEHYMNRMSRQGKYMGQVLKNQSDMIMDATFTNDPAYRVCYIQDKGTIWPKQTLNEYKKAKAVFAEREIYDMDELAGHGFEAIDAKYFVNRYYSIAGDSVDYHLQFRPGAHGSNPNIRTGALIFIPDDLGVYNLWMIVARDDQPQFPKYFVLKCNLLLKWFIGHDALIKFEGTHVDVGTRFSWSVQRTQSSYNSGVWTDYLTTAVENVIKAIVPTNFDTKTISYNEHFVISNNELRRIAWEVSKVEDTTTPGLTKLTFKQELEYSSVDNLGWVNLTSENYSANLAQTGINYDFYCPRYNDVEQHAVILEVDEPIKYSIKEEPQNIITYSGVKPNVKIGGGYKTFTANLNIIGKPYWSIDYIANGEVICTLDFMYNGNELICNDTREIFNIDKSNKISYIQDDRKTFGIQFKYNQDKPNELKIKCQSVLDMIGNKLIIRAGNSSFETSASLEVEVEAL